MADITFLGIGAAQTPDSEPVSFIVEADEGRKLLVETPPSIGVTLPQAGYSVADLDAIFLSHSHGDRTLGYPYLMFLKHLMRLSKQGSEQVQVLATQAMHNGLGEMLKFCYPPGSWGTFTIEPIVTDKDMPATIADAFTYEVTTADHSIPTQAIAITVDGKKIVYSSDTAYSPAIVQLAMNADLLIHDAMVTQKAGFATATKHSTSTDAAQTAQEADVKQLMLVHLDATMLTEDNRQTLLREASDHYSGDVVIPEPFHRYSL